jgi:aromatic-L-amino-acid decarboxylase
MPDVVRARLQTGLPTDPAPLDEVYGECQETVAAYPMGNIHPRFWGWYMGSSNFTGALGDFLAAVDGSNLVGGNTGAGQVMIANVSGLMRPKPRSRRTARMGCNRRA